MSKTKISIKLKAFEHKSLDKACAKIVEKKSKKGKVFYGCNNYPKCKEAYWDKPTGELCPSCGSMLIEKKDIIKCNNCDYTK